MAKVLLIDDDENYRKVIKGFLLKSGHEVIEAINGDIGLNLFLEIEPAIVITDILMPECDGIEFLHALSTMTHGTPVICMSGGISGDTAWITPLIKSLGAVNLLKKPFSYEELMETMKKLLPTYPARL